MKKVIILIALVFTYSQLVIAQAPNEPPYVSEDEWENSDPEAQLVPNNKSNTSNQKKKPKYYHREQAKELKDGEKRIKHPLAKKGLIRIDKHGTYIYKSPASSESASSTIKLSKFAYTNWTNDTLGVSFEDIYDTTEISLQLDWESRLGERFGTFSWIYGIGLNYATGNGRFVGSPTSEAIESYSLFVVPISLGMVYKFRFTNKQWLIPYVQAGGDISAIMEIRDDGEGNMYYFAPNAYGAGGVSFLLDNFMQDDLIELDRDYGINHVRLNLEFKITQGLDSKVDTSSQQISAGFAFDY